MDPTDNRIIDILVRDGRASYSTIGAAVGLSAHAVGERVRRLERRGVITGYTAILDDAARGFGVHALVDVRLLPATDPHDFERVARELAGLRHLLFVTGRFDFVVELTCENATALDDAVRLLRTRGGVAATETRIVMRAAGVR